MAECGRIVAHALKWLEDLAESYAEYYSQAHNCRIHDLEEFCAMQETTFKVIKETTAELERLRDQIYEVC